MLRHVRPQGTAPLVRHALTTAPPWPPESDISDMSGIVTVGRQVTGNCTFSTFTQSLTTVPLWAENNLTHMSVVVSKVHIQSITVTL